MRIHLRILTLATAAELVIRPPLSLSISVLLISALVLALELVNTAVEAVADIASEGEWSTLAKTAKDASAGAVLVAALVALAVGAYVVVRMWPLQWKLWSTAHSTAALLNGVVLIATVTVLLVSKGRTAQTVEDDLLHNKGGKRKL